MSNATFKSVKNSREPFSSLSTSEGVVFGDTSGAIQVSGNILPGDKSYKVIELFGDEAVGATNTSNILRDSDGNIWLADEAIEIVGAEFSFTPTTSGNNASISGIGLKVDKSTSNNTSITAGPDIINVIGSLNVNVQANRKVSFLHSKPLASEGSPIITLEQNNRLYVTPNGPTNYLMKVYVKLYYR